MEGQRVQTQTRPARRRRPATTETPAPSAEAEEISTSEQKAPGAMSSFGDLELSAPVARAIKEMGYSIPTPIQSEAIPPFMMGEDLVGRAKTGTGKTAAFGIPLCERLDPREISVQALVLVPTRQ